VGVTGEGVEGEEEEEIEIEGEEKDRLPSFCSFSTSVSSFNDSNHTPHAVSRLVQSCWVGREWFDG